MAGKKSRRRPGRGPEGKGGKKDEGEEGEDEEGETGEDEDDAANPAGAGEEEEDEDEEEGEDDNGEGEGEGEADEELEGDDAEEEGDSEEDEAYDEDDADDEDEGDDDDDDEEDEAVDEDEEAADEDEEDEDEDEEDDEEDEVEEEEDNEEEEDEEEEDEDEEESEQEEGSSRKKKKKKGRRGGGAGKGKSRAAGARKSVAGKKEKEKDKGKDKAPHRPGESRGQGAPKPKGPPKTVAPAEEYKALRGRLLHNKQDKKALDALSALPERLGDGEEDQALAKSIQATLAYAAGLEAATRGDFAVAAEKLEAAASGGERAGAAAAEAHLHLAQDRFRAVLAEGRRCDRRAKRGAEAAPAEARQAALEACREAASRARAVADAARNRLAEEKPKGRKDVMEVERERQRLGQVEEAAVALLQKLDEAPTAEEENEGSNSGQILVCRAEGALPRPEEEDLSSSDDSGVESDTEAAEEENKKKTKALVMEIFHSFDTNGDGHISQDELRVVLLKIGFDQETITELFAVADVDGDGRIIYNEFFDWVFGGSSPDFSPLAGLEQQRTEGGAAEPSATTVLTALKPVLLQDRRLCRPEGQPAPEATQTSEGTSAAEKQEPKEAVLGPERQEAGEEAAQEEDASGREGQDGEEQPGLCFSQTKALLGMAVDSLVPMENAKHPLRAEAGSALMEISASSPEDASDQELVNFLFFDSMPKTHVSIDSIQAVARPELLKRFLAKVAEDQSCVEATFHGTKEERVAGILEGGLSTRCCSVGLYGSGAYVGTHAGLAHKYTLPNGKGRRYMFVVLVDVGPEVVEGNHATSRKQGKTSVDRLANPTQYCLFNQDRLFVSHLITYHVRKQKDERGHFTRELSKAVVRAGERARARGSL